MHALVAAIVLRLAGARADQLDAERHQPGRELGEPTARPGRDERRAVVALDRSWRAVLDEELLEHAAHARTTGVGQQPDCQYETAVRVADRKRLALLSVARPPPALEVHRPEIVRAGELEVRTTVNGPDAYRRAPALHFA